jgi:uncharacterized protein (TIGR02300 family)
MLRPAAFGALPPGFDSARRAWQQTAPEGASRKENSPVNKPELGVKRDCPSCGARFYDLNKEPAHCPRCAHEFVPEALLKPRKPRREDEPAEGAEAAPKPAAEVPLDAAEKEQKAPKSKRKPGLDEEGDVAGGDDELGDLEDMDIEIDDDDDDTLLEEDEDEDDDMGGIVSGGEEEDA